MADTQRDLWAVGNRVDFLVDEFAVRRDDVKVRVKVLAHIPLLKVRPRPTLDAFCTMHPDAKTVARSCVTKLLNAPHSPGTCKGTKREAVLVGHDVKAHDVLLKLARLQEVGGELLQRRVRVGEHLGYEIFSKRFVVRCHRNDELAAHRKRPRTVELVGLAHDSIIRLGKQPAGFPDTIWIHPGPREPHKEPHRKPVDLLPHRIPDAERRTRLQSSFTHPQHLLVGVRSGDGELNVPHPSRQVPVCHMVHQHRVRFCDLVKHRIFESVAHRIELGRERTAIAIEIAD